jgi:hypothetical protein
MVCAAWRRCRGWAGRWPHGHRHCTAQAQGARNASLLLAAVALAAKFFAMGAFGFAGAILTNPVITKMVNNLWERLPRP